MESPRHWGAVVGASHSNNHSFTNSSMPATPTSHAKPTLSLPSLAYVFGRNGQDMGSHGHATSALPTPPGSGEFEKETFGTRDSSRDYRDAEDHFPLFPPLPGQASAFATVRPRQQSSPRNVPSPSLRYLPPPEDQRQFSRTINTYVRDYVREHEWHYPTSRPSRNDYRLALECLQESRNLVPSYRELERAASVGTESERSWTDFDRVASPDVHASQELRYAPFDSPAPLQHKDLGSVRSRRRKRTSPPAEMQREASVYEPTTPVKRQRSSKPSRRTLSTSSSSAMKQSKHSRSGATKVRRSREPDDYAKDICPPLEMGKNVLEEASRIARKDVNHPKEIGEDEYKHELHEAELNVAAKLNLASKEFLCVKRQIFEAFLAMLKQPVGKKWNKTAAQEATNVDVTKVSSIFEFYNNIGFFEESLYSERLKHPIRQDRPDD